MRVMVLVKATADSEAGVMPSTELIEAMGSYNQQLFEAGIMKSGDGLKPTSEGKRVRFDGADRTVTDGPFSQTNEIVAGYWLWEVKDMDEAVEWVKRAPNPMPGPSEIEIRPLYELEDFADAITDEQVEREERMREELEGGRVWSATVSPKLKGDEYDGHFRECLTRYSCARGSESCGYIGASESNIGGLRSLRRKVMSGVSKRYFGQNYMRARFLVEVASMTKTSSPSEIWIHCVPRMPPTGVNEMEFP